MNHIPIELFYLSPSPLNPAYFRLHFTLRQYQYQSKHFYLRNFFQQHSVSNKRICDIKRIFIQLTQQFYQFGLIQPKVKLMLHSNYIDIEDLTTFNISDGFILYEKILSK